MGSNFSPKEIIEKIKELNKNCIIILGNEPVVSNHIKKEIRCFSDLNNIEYKSINLDKTTKLNDVKPLFENDSLFTNKTQFSILISSGRLLDGIKQFIVKVILDNTDDLFVFRFQNPTKELLKSSWFQEINKKSIQLEAEEPNSQKIQQAIKARADFHGLNIDNESIAL